MKDYKLYRFPLTFLQIWLACFCIFPCCYAQDANQDKKDNTTGSKIQDAQFFIDGINADKTEIEKDNNAITKNKATIDDINKTPVKNDPTVAQQKAAYETAYGAAKSYFQQNNGKYTVGTGDLAAVQAQQKTLNAAANKAGAAYKEAEDQVENARKNQIKKIQEENAKYEAAMKKSISHLEKMLNGLNLLGAFLNDPCVQQIAAGGNLVGSEICLNKLFDNQNVSRLRDNLNNTKTNLGTNFFNGNNNGGAIVDMRIVTSSGNVEGWEGLPVDNGKTDQLKKEAWEAAIASGAKTSQEQYAVYQKYLQDHPSTGNTQSIYNPEANFQISEKTAKVKQITVPPPATENTKPSSAIDIFSNSIREAIDKMKNYLNQPPIKVKVPGSAAAVRG